MSSPNTGRPLLTIALLLFHAASLMLAASSSADDVLHDAELKCRRIQIDPRAPLSSVFNAEIDNGGNISVIDLWTRQIVLLSPDGQFIKADKLDIVELEPFEEVRKNRTREVVFSFYDWILVGDVIFGFGAINSDHLEIGFLAGTKFDSGTVHLVERAEKNDILYRVGYHYLAAIGSNVYYLDMTGAYAELHRYNIDDDREYLVGYSSDLWGPIQSVDDRIDFFPRSLRTDVYRLIEKSSLPVGVYAQDGNIYTLERTPDPDGGTRWLLTKLIPDRDGVTKMGTITLPMNTSHVTVLPSDHSWIFFLKRAVTEAAFLGNEPSVGSMLVIPKIWILDDSSPLYKESRCAYGQ